MVVYVGVLVCSCKNPGFCLNNRKDGYDFIALTWVSSAGGDGNRNDVHLN